MGKIEVFHMVGARPQFIKAAVVLRTLRKQQVCEVFSHIGCTDSGDVQKEGYFFGTPRVIPRKDTEWIELLEIGINKLVGPDNDRICEAVFELFLNCFIKIVSSSLPPSLYRDGRAAKKIAKILKEACHE